MADKPIVYDLDILRPSPKYVLLASKKIDISFIPSGVAIDIMEMRQQLEKFADTPEKIKKIEEGGKEALDTFHITAAICAKITQTQHEEMTKEWLLQNTSVIQLQRLVEHISDAVFASLESVEDDTGKNQKAVKTTPH